MNLNLQEKEKTSRKRLAFYIVIAIICILSIVVVIGIQILGSDVINNIFGINKLSKRTEQEEKLLKENFENLFTNEFRYEESYNTQKIDNDKEIVYTGYQKEEKNENYEININLPIINIKNKTIQNFNDEIEKTYQKKAEDVLNSSDVNNIIYTVKYEATIENGILSVALYSDLKQGASAQRVIVQTFNFNLEENKQLSLEDILKIYKLNKNTVQNKINEDIGEETKKTNGLKELGYNVFSRDIEDENYKIENIKEFFIRDNNIYIVFAYGNEKLTSELDIVII